MNYIANVIGLSALISWVSRVDTIRILDRQVFAHSSRNYTSVNCVLLKLCDLFLFFYPQQQQQQSEQAASAVMSRAAAESHGA